MRAQVTHVHTDEDDYREVPRYTLSVKLGVAW
jgi:hypothetical protein